MFLYFKHFIKVKFYSDCLHCNLYSIYLIYEGYDINLIIILNHIGQGQLLF